MPALASANDIYRVHTSTQDIIKRALRLIGVLESGEPLPAGQLKDALEAFNDMVDAWNTEKLIIWALARNTLTLTASTNPHEIGPGVAAPGFDAPRPNRIVQGQAYLSGASLGTDEARLDVWEHDQFEQQHDSSQSGRPCALYYEPSFPNGKIWLDMKPDAAYSLILWLETMLHQVFLEGVLGGDGTTTELSLPPGYKEAITHNLAIRLALEYGRSAPVEVINGAVESKANIKRLNQRPLYLEIDPALASPGIFDITTGTYR